jgi:hypothetical protein
VCFNKVLSYDCVEKHLFDVFSIHSGLKQGSVSPQQAKFKYMCMSYHQNEEQHYNIEAVIKFF